MQLNITGHHVDLTDSLKTYVNTKLQKKYCLMFFYT